jgi:hypothetical protein
MYDSPVVALNSTNKRFPSCGSRGGYRVFGGHQELPLAVVIVLSQTLVAWSKQDVLHGVSGMPVFYLYLCTLTVLCFFMYLYESMSWVVKAKSV